MKFIFTYILIGFFGIGLESQTPLTLQGAIDMGLQQRLEIQVANNTIAAAERENTWARAGKTPIVNVNANLNNNLQQNNNPASFLQGTIYLSGLSADISGQMPLYSGGRINSAKQLLDLNQALAEQSIHEATNTVRQNVRDAYYRVLSIQETIKVLEQVIQLSKDRLALGQVRKEYGKANGLELRQLQDAIFTDSINLVQQKLAINNAMLSLKNAMNDGSIASYILVDGLNPNTALLTQEKVLEIVNQNVSLKQAAVRKQLAQTTVDAQINNTHPSLNLNGAAIFSENLNKFFGTNPNTGETYKARWGNVLNGVVGLSATYPLYNGGLNRDNIAIAKIRYETSNLQYQQLKLAVENQAMQLINNHNANVEILNLIGSRVKNAEQNMIESEERYKLGQLSSFDYRTTQLQWLNAQLTLLNTRLTIALTESALMSLAGE